MPFFKKPYRIFTVYCLTALISELILTFALEPVYVTLYSDAVFQSSSFGSLLTAFLYYAIQILNPAIFTFSIALMCSLFFCFWDKRKMRNSYIAILFSINLIKYICKILAVLIFNGVKAIDFFSVLIQLGLDYSVFIVILILTYVFTKKHTVKARTLDKAYRLSEGHGYDVNTGVYPVPSFVMPKHVCLCGLFWSSIIQCALSLFSLLYYDAFFYGFPTDISGTVDMITEYIGRIVLYTLMYILGYFLIRALLKASCSATENSAEAYNAIG